MFIDDVVHPDLLDPNGLLAATDAYIDALLDHLGSLGGRQLLEVGCSDGWNLLNAVDRGAVVWGVDGSAALLWLARERLPEADFRLGAPEELPFDSVSFDIVCRFGITSDGRDLASSVGEMARVCRRGGTIAVTVTGADDDEAVRRADAVKRIAAGLGIDAADYCAADGAADAVNVPIRAVILTR